MDEIGRFGFKLAFVDVALARIERHRVLDDGDQLVGRLGCAIAEGFFCSPAIRGRGSRPRRIFGTTSSPSKPSFLTTACSSTPAAPPRSGPSALPGTAPGVLVRKPKATSVPSSFWSRPGFPRRFASTPLKPRHACSPAPFRPSGIGLPPSAWSRPAPRWRSGSPPSSCASGRTKAPFGRLGQRRDRNGDGPASGARAARHSFPGARPPDLSLPSRGHP